jgi:NTP pyrophosphatase (non-canonical NTP hydrolase)
MLNNSTKETLLILQEECAEVTQAVSKVFRFGFDSVWPESDVGPNNKQKLEEEVGDLLAMIDILVETSVLSDASVNLARRMKKDKLRVWSNIYDNHDLVGPDGC